jgi:hypothetical protein
VVDQSALPLHLIADQQLTLTALMDEEETEGLQQYLSSFLYGEHTTANVTVTTTLYMIGGLRLSALEQVSPVGLRLSNLL